MTRRIPRYHGIEIPADLPPALAAFAEAVKNRLEQHSGDVGDPKDRFVTMRDLELAGASVGVKNSYAIVKGLGGTTEAVNADGSVDIGVSSVAVITAIMAAGVGSADELPGGYQVVTIDPVLKALRRFPVEEFVGLHADDDADITGTWTFDDIYITGQIFLDEDPGALGYIMTSGGDADSELPPTWQAPGALTRVDDTNVTLTLGGTPATALLKAVTLTLGWTGTLAATRGGTGFGSYTAGDMLYANGTTTLAKLNIGSANYFLRVSGSAPAWAAPAALTKTDDTNVTLTLGGTPASALMQSVSLTLGWTGTLAATRGGTGFGSYTIGDILYASSTSAFSKLGIGDEEFVLTVVDGVPAWAESTGGGGGGADFAPEVRGASFSNGVTAVVVPTNKVPINIREDCEIQSVVVLTQGGTGSCVLDIWKHPYSTFPPTVSDSICASAKPTISAGVKYTDSTLTGWTTVLSAGDTLLVNLESSTVFTAITLFLILVPVGSTALDGYTDERARDVIAAALTDTDTVVWTYDDSGDTLTADVVTTELDVFTSTDKGVVPASGGGTTNFLRADGTFAAPAGSTAQTSGTFTGTLTYGVISPITGTNTTFRWIKVGDFVSLWIPDLQVLGTPGGGSQLSLSGIPTAIRPARTSAVPVLVTPGGGAQIVAGALEIYTNGLAQLYYYKPSVSGDDYMSQNWLNSQNIGFASFSSSGQCITYSVN